jgi:hypothetical protein
MNLEERIEAIRARRAHESNGAREHQEELLATIEMNRRDAMARDAATFGPRRPAAGRVTAEVPDLSVGRLSTTADLNRAAARLREAQGTPAARATVSAPAPARVLATLQVDGMPLEVTDDAHATADRLRAAIAARARRAQDAKEIAEARTFADRIRRALGYRPRDVRAHFSDRSRAVLARMGYSSARLNRMEHESADALAEQDRLESR